MTTSASLHLTKLSATGNDFLVLVDVDGIWGPRGSDALDAGARRALCDRHTGIGADGLIRVLPATEGTDCGFELSNADGGFAEMSGNGMRCLAWAARRAGLGTTERLVVDTPGGPRIVDLGTEGGEVVRADVDMGAVTFDPAAIPVDATSPFGLDVAVDGFRYQADAAGMGNPHLVLFVDDIDRAAVEQHGPVLEHDARVPRRTNVEFVQLREGALRMRTWERGVGETLSCGTGACAAGAVAHRRGLVPDRLAVHVRGGELSVVLGDTVRLGGPVEPVFAVDVDLARIRRGQARARTTDGGDRA
jgi:diaminopimelate epimerase